MARIATPRGSAQRPSVTFSRVAVAASSLIVGVAALGVFPSPPAGAVVSALYAYSGGTSNSLTCPQDSGHNPAVECSLARALARASILNPPSRTIYLASAGANLSTAGDPSHYTGNWSIDLTHTTSTAPIVIGPAPGLTSAPILDGNQGVSTGACATASCADAILTVTTATLGTGFLTLQGFTMTGGNNSTSTDGGAINNGDGQPGGSVTLSSMTLVSNTSAYDGGAIDNADNGGSGSLAITNSTFTSNSAGSDGGAVDSADNAGTGSLTITNSTFTSNSAGSDGGAVANADNAGSGPLVISTSTFTSNSAVWDGGAVASAVNGPTTGTAISSPASITASTFTSNTSEDDGGAIDNADYNGVGPLTVTSSTFTGNSALTDGGAVDNGDNGGTAPGSSVSTSTFDSNAATSNDGGAIDNADYGGTATLHVSKSTFTNNSAAMEGGAIDNADDGGSGTLTVVASTLVGSSAGSDGPAIANVSTSSTGVGSVTLAADQIGDPCAPNTGTWIDAGYNTGDPSCWAGGPHNAPSTSLAATLGTLGSNGGPTATIAPGSGNPGISLIPNPTTVTIAGATRVLCATTDQRGTANQAGMACYAGSYQGAPSTATITSAPLSFTASTSVNQPVTVSLVDPFGSPITPVTDTVVTLGTTSGQGSFATSVDGPTSTSVTIPAGSSTATAYYGDTTAGHPTLTASSSGVLASSQAESVLAGPPASLLVSAPPRASSGTGFSMTITVHDALANVVAGYTGTVHVTSSDASAVLPSDYTFVTGDAGTHSLPVTLATPGTQSLSAADTVSASLTGSTAVGVEHITVVSPSNQHSTSGSGITPLTVTATGAAPGATLTWLATGLPTGLTISPTTGTITGTPTSACTCGVTIRANDGSYASGTASFTWTVVAAQHGYWLVGSDGGIFTFGSAQFRGSTGNFSLQRPVVGITPTSDRLGYWLVATDGGIFAFGDSGFYGSIPGIGLAPAGTPGSTHALAAPIVAMVPSSDGKGYFMVASDGGVFAFGDAHFAGSCPGIGGCSGPAVAVMPDASGLGYYLVTATGNVYAFGDAKSKGQPGSQGSVVTSAVRTPSGLGYWILFANGTVTSFGDAALYGSPIGQTGGTNPATAIFATGGGRGYWVAAANGALYNFGDAPNDGSMAGSHLNGQIIAATGW